LGSFVESRKGFSTCPLRNVRSNTMVDPVTVGMAIGAAKLAVKACSDIKAISKSLDVLFEASDNNKDKKPRTEMQKALRARTGEDADIDETSIASVANSVLEQKQNELNLRLLGKEIDRKFGLGSWDEILIEREKRQKQKTIDESKAKIAARFVDESDQPKPKWFQALLIALQIVIISGAVIGIGYAIFINRCVQGKC
jgi:hypothetical protein